jgi:hypothetical protein
MPRQIFGIDAKIDRTKFGRQAQYPCTAIQTSANFDDWLKSHVVTPREPVHVKVILQRDTACPDTLPRAPQKLWEERDFEDWASNDDFSRRLDPTVIETYLSEQVPKTPKGKSSKKGTKSMLYPRIPMMLTYVRSSG